MIHHQGALYCALRDRTITVILANLPDHGSLVIQICWSNFNYLSVFYNNSNCIYELYICASVGQ